MPVTSPSSGSALPLPVSNGNQSMMSKDIASLTDKALIIKQEIEKMKMRKVMDICDSLHRMLIVVDSYFNFEHTITWFPVYANTTIFFHMSSLLHSLL